MRQEAPDLDRVAETADLHSVREGYPLWLVSSGVGLLAGAVVWTFLSAGNPTPGALAVAGLLLAAAAAVVVGVAASRIGSWLIPMALIGFAAMLWVQDPAGTLSTQPLSGPLGYANANGAFFAQASIAGLMLLAGRVPIPLRVLGGGAAVAFALVPFATASYAAGILLVVLGPLAVAAWRPRVARLLVAGFGALFVAALAATILIGALFSPMRDRSGSLDRLVDATISERRGVLWHESLALTRLYPITGFGPGSFAAVSPTARADADARWAHHGFLQQGVEGGIPAFGLLVLLFLWGFVALWLHPAPDRVTALGAVALAALGIQACIDYTLHFPAVPVAAAALVGVALAVRRTRSHADRHAGP